MEAVGIDEAGRIGGTDGISLRRWWLVFTVYVALLAVPAAVMLARLDAPWRELFIHAGRFQAPWHQVLKLLIFTLYLTVCCTFCPLPTGWLVAAVATREVALTGQLGTTVLLVAAAGAVGSTMANLNDYHLFTLLLRHHRVAAVRNTRVHRIAARWFARAPFTFLVVSNIIPIPVDVIRMLAATARYPRGAFAAGNFLGRFIRYGILAVLAFGLHVSALAAAGIMLAVAAVLGSMRVGPALVRKMRCRRVKADGPILEGHRGSEGVDGT